MNIDALISGFKALGQPTRLHIIRLLAEQDLCVCELTEVLQTSQPRISQHLKVLKNAGLVKESIEGSMRIYHLQKTNLENYFSSFNSFLSEPTSDDVTMNTYLNSLKNLDDNYRFTK